MASLDDNRGDEKSFVVTTGKYAGYKVKVAKIDAPNDIWYEECGPQVLRVHYRLYRIPSRPEFQLRHFAAATAEDRANAEATLGGVPAFFAKIEAGGTLRRLRADEGYYYWTFCAGTMLDDPMMQLELEMMIDLGSEVAA